MTLALVRPNERPTHGPARPGPWLVAAAVLYSGWLLELVLPTGLSIVDSYVSELLADDQPYRWLFRLTDALAACCLLVAARRLPGRLDGPLPGRVGDGLPGSPNDQLGGHAPSQPSDRPPSQPRNRLAGRLARWLHDRSPGRLAGRLLTVAIVAFAAATLADTVLSLDCAASVDALCRYREDTGAVSPGHLLHQVTSILTFCGALVAAVALDRRTRRWDARVVVALLVTTGVLSAVLANQPGAGLVQRAQLLAVAACLLLMARSCRRGRSG